MTSLIMLFIAIFCVASLTYVYAYRGQARYASFGEYLRKGWPIFTPFNCLLYLFTKSKAKPAIMDMTEFPELQELQDNWEMIREEALELMAEGGFDSIGDPKSASYYDVGFRTFYKYGWTKFYLNWYGYTHESAKSTCPKTIELLSKIPSVNGAMFSVLPPGGQLTRHLDPVACSLRYHLGLDTPNDDKCYISIDDTPYSWRDGEPLLFDVTFLHFAHNDAHKPRLILMCDIERPMSWLGSILNWPYKILMKAFIVPNTDADKRGLFNRIFAGLIPALERSKNLKETNLVAYKTLKYTVNTTLFVLLGLLVWGVISGVIWLVS
ncbi:MAG TPA: aspartyl/asparaginyl beta-hydroxylase domain-containing protein [Gammaproteobacteria bacterium]|nr:aspartyl/asparaginyl beta-hydroxylase domain-containing protein [Gammaproteobacteria bacterium]